MRDDRTSTQQGSAAERERRLAKARAHLTVVAAGLVEVLGPANTVGILLGAACGVLTTHNSDEAAVSALRALADELEAGAFDGPSTPTGRA